MAASDLLGHALAIAVGTLPIVLVPACAQVTGLSDDYTYDLVDGASAQDSASAKDATSSATRETGTPVDAGNQCMTAQQAQTQSTLTNAGASTVSAQCRACLASSCCTEIATCASQDTCVQSMKCIFNCQNDKGGNKNQCLNSCGAAFTNQVGRCVQKDCSSFCQLQ